MSSKFNPEKKLQKPAEIVKFLRVLELLAGFEPATCWLRISCSTDWATAASYENRPIAVFCFCALINSQRPHHYEWCALPLSHASILIRFTYFSFLIKYTISTISDLLITNQLLSRLSYTSVLYLIELTKTKKKCPLTDNQRPSHYEWDALPLSHISKYDCLTRSAVANQPTLPTKICWHVTLNGYHYTWEGIIRQEAKR